MTTTDEPLFVPDPGWSDTHDGCQAVYTPNLAGVDMSAIDVLDARSKTLVELLVEAVKTYPVGMCELEPDHLTRGEPHMITLTWFEPVAEPDCAACSDTGQVAGEPCPENCDRAKWLRGEAIAPDETAEIRALVDQSSLGGWSAPDD